MKTRICKVCGEEKPEDEFMYKNKRKGRGRNNLCRECSVQRLVEWQETHPLKVHHTALKSRAKRKGVKFSLSYDEFADWYAAQERYDDIPTCFYCGRQLDFEHATQLNGATIDRLDTTLGYSANNMVFCCRRCNVMKGNWLYDGQMLEIADKYFKDEDKTL